MIAESSSHAVSLLGAVSDGVMIRLRERGTDAVAPAARRPDETPPGVTKQRAISACASSGDVANGARERAALVGGATVFDA